MSILKLTINVCNIQDVQFADRTEIVDHVLHINRLELQELLLEDQRLSRVEIELAHPGESCRILHHGTGGGSLSNSCAARAKLAAFPQRPGRLGREGRPRRSLRSRSLCGGFMGRFVVLGLAAAGIIWWGYGAYAGQGELIQPL